MEKRNREEEEIKKGPWTAEEDEILMNFVKENGPKDWSSIRSKGLLPRTGKSCRLRWVNKLQPNLKKGCKFSAEEERLVLELQATVGNKWAAIATYLPGRTDNDVKNFWSTRQKRLARIMRSSSQPNRALKKKGKTTVVDEASSSFQDFKFSANQGKSASLQCDICSCLCSENFKAVYTLPAPHCFTPCVVDVNTSQPPMVDVHTNPPLLGMQSNDIIKASTSSANEICFTIDQLLNPTINDLSLGQENHDFGMELIEQNLMEGFANQEAFQLGNMAQHQNYGDIDNYKENMIPMPANVFDEFSDDMIDNLETVPRSSSCDFS